MKSATRTAAWLALALWPCAAGAVEPLSGKLFIQPETPGLIAAPAVAAPVFPSFALPQAAARMAPRVEELRRFSVSGLFASLDDDQRRDFGITAITEPMFQRMSGEEVVAILKQVHWPGLYENAPASADARVVHGAAWTRLRAENVLELMADWDAKLDRLPRHRASKKYTEGALKAAIVKSWILAHPDEAREWPALIGRIPAGKDRDQLIIFLADRMRAGPNSY